ncbi:class I SAM-dependent RNA methyltransferase [Rhodococcus sp. BP-252]|uniref:RNA methyltransferase n=1 Tax=Rhodococcoides kyotonense TaxID=398843 RepID=A0A177YI71_9NOCA|nr:MULTISPECIES: TRAM domain-containing protein [Rhodococcus]MBY6410938.1 class I SAM-dependent RNA methyltransferase [Rhodococcus sp. BP-320]MBY6415597.1 class I SAM-dependent RNA methyltransferase [Rhodococcus sp. BP-321]MBY6421021.1 class I SAM-dependent RNA methyltransferase [Rhodococcus sp. BP-324]MBY6426076.1 class I SAM-dependent RNA methyltransferase [Rhodococcus sp. BP-323]MBY6430803.1 class I SAM-dependent RNA methyltransferase [Rhodococcus sp. BP-322]
MTENWFGRTIEVTLGPPGHGGFCVARHDGRVMFVRHGLPGEVVRAKVTEDRGGSFCRADAVEIVSPSPDRIPQVCPISGPGGSGCCDYSHATVDAGRAMKAAVVAEQLRRIAGIDRDVTVEGLPGDDDGTRWRTRVRLGVDGAGRAGFHRFRSSTLVTDLGCPQVVAGALDGLDAERWRPGSELAVAVDGDDVRHVVEVAPAAVSRTGRRSPGRRGAAARRAAASRPRPEKVVEGTGRPHEYVSGRQWELDATGFWQAHRNAAQVYSDVVSEWADAAAGSVAWDLYGGVGVFAASVADAVGPSGRVASVEFSRRAAADGAAALADSPQIEFVPGRVERVVASLPSPSVVVLDPPRSGADKDVVSAIEATDAHRVVHIGCDPASFARDTALYRAAGFEFADMRAFDAFPLSHHVECIGLFVR